MKPLRATCLSVSLLALSLVTGGVVLAQAGADGAHQLPPGEEAVAPAETPGVDDAVDDDVQVPAVEELPDVEVPEVDGPADVVQPPVVR